LRKRVTRPVPAPGYWFWAVSWHLPPGTGYVQSVLNHPSTNISIGTVDDDGATPNGRSGECTG
jgi:hypothetical protein